MYCSNLEGGKRDILISEIRKQVLWKIEKSQQGDNVDPKVESGMLVFGLLRNLDMI